MIFYQGREIVCCVQHYNGAIGCDCGLLNPSNVGNIKETQQLETKIKKCIACKDKIYLSLKFVFNIEFYHFE